MTRDTARSNLQNGQGWEGWLAFFLEGVATMADAAIQTARDLFTIVGEGRECVLASGSATVVSLRLVELLPQHPVDSSIRTMLLTQTSCPTASKALAVLEQAGVLVEMTGKKRDRTDHFADYLERLREGTEL